MASQEQNKSRGTWQLNPPCLGRTLSSSSDDKGAECGQEAMPRQAASSNACKSSLISEAAVALLVLPFIIIILNSPPQDCSPYTSLLPKS